MMVEETKLAKLRELITEGLRVQRDVDAITYINVGHALEDASARANHVIFARRGCGKTLLLHDLRSKLKPDIRSIYLNCEDFKQHTFPNVLIEILKALFREIGQNLGGWFGKKARTKAIVKQILERLDKMHQTPDVHTEQVKETADQEFSKKLGLELSGEQSKAKGKFGAEGTTHTHANTERTFERHKQKLQELDLWLPDLNSRVTSSLVFF